MTLERAVEIVLNGQAFTPCPLCAGRAALMVHDEYEACDGCAGRGVHRVQEYEEACAVLGKELPPWPYTALDRAFNVALEGMRARGVILDMNAVNYLRKNWGDEK